MLQTFEEAESTEKDTAFLVQNAIDINKSKARSPGKIQYSTKRRTIFDYLAVRYLGIEMNTTYAKCKVPQF